MNKKIIVSLMFATLLLGGCQQGASDKTKGDKPAVAEGKQVNISQLAADVRSKYDEVDLEFSESLSVGRDERIKLDIGFKPKDKGMKAYTEIVEVYKDSNLEHVLGTHFDMDDAATYVEVLPPRSTGLGVSNTNAERKDFGNNLADVFLFDKGQNKDWGNFKELYMVVKVDLTTGDPLDKPVVTKVAINHELRTDLRLKMTLNEDGLAEFSWNEVAGAEYYYIVDVSEDPDTGVQSLANIREKISETFWEAQPDDIVRTYKVSELERRTKENIEKYGEGTEPIPNESNQQTRYGVIAVSEDGTSAISNLLNINELSKRIARHEEVAESSKKEGKKTVVEMGMLPSYRWVTMNDGSLVQKLINYDITKAKEETELWSTSEKEDLSDLEAHEIELITIPYTVEGTPFGGKARVENYHVDTWQDELAAIKKRQDELRNKAGSTQVEIVPEDIDEEESRDDEQEKTDKGDQEEKKEKKRQTEKSEESTERTAESETKETTESKESKRRKSKDDEKTKDSSVAETKETKEKDDSKGSKRRQKREREEAKAESSQESTTDTEESSRESETKSSETKTRRQKTTETSESTAESTTAESKERKNRSDETVSEADDQITANNPLSEYLAINMLDAKETIDISDFPEALIQDDLFDAWMEAIYQNPLILSVKGAQIADFGKSLVVTYDIDRAEMKEKQSELRAEVKSVISEIIDDNMTDLEKEYAINAYLIEVAEYDDGALENAEKNNFVSVDAEFNDSFTPYGVLVNKVGVCASYAGAFKLLADEAGLEAIVVTGYLEGDLPHAWNKVKIGDNWHILDTTNNDNDLLTNALLNIPELASRKVLVEDDRYVLNSHIADYKASDEDKDIEFYHVEEKFYDKDKIVDELVSSIDKDGSAALRTNYSLTDDDFDIISGKVYDATKDDELQGLYWMGVIYLIGSK